MSKEKVKSKTNSRNARFGNKNAQGNKGGYGGPPQNKNAVKTHEFEKIFNNFDLFYDNEKEIFNCDYDKYIQQYILIDTLTIREVRMFHSIKKLRDKLNLNIKKTYNSIDVSPSEGNDCSIDDHQDNINNKSDISANVFLSNQYTHLMAIEDALTRVQSKKQRALEILHKMEIEDKQLQILKQKLSLYMQRLKGLFNIDNLQEELIDAPVDDSKPS